MSNFDIKIELEDAISLLFQIEADMQIDLKIIAKKTRHFSLYDISIFRSDDNRYSNEMFKG